MNNNSVAATQTGPTFTPIAGTGLKVTFTTNPDTILSQADINITVTPQRTAGLVGQFVLQFHDTYKPNPGTCSYTGLSPLAKPSAQC